MLIFDLTADFAHFRLGYTTSSSSTHLAPPRHTVAGIIGAILGVDRGDLSSTFSPDRCKIGVSVHSKLSVLRITMNQILVKGKITLEKIMTHDQHSQIPFQMVKQPRYRVYFWHEDPELYGRLRKMLQNHECVYSPSLGLAQLLADFSWVGEITEVKPAPAGQMSTRSVVPLEVFNPQPDTRENHMVMDRQARHLESDRIADRFYRVVFDSHGTSPLPGELLEEDGVSTPIVIDKGQVPEVAFLW